MIITDISLKKLKPGDKEQVIRIDRHDRKKGFCLRLRPNGTKTFVYLFKYRGKLHKLNLGTYPAVSLATASAAFEANYEIVKGGGNPIEEKKAAVIEAEEVRKTEERNDILKPTVAKLVDEFILKHAREHTRRWQDTERMLKKEVVPIWGDLKAEDIGKRDIVLLLEGIIERGAPISSNQVFKHIRKMFNFAVERDILKYSPCMGVKALAPNKTRDRVLTEIEVKTLWTVLPTLPISTDIQRALKLILVTAQRPGEVAGMHTREINGHWWTIPAERSKNKKTHRVYLTALAMEIITEAKTDAQTAKERAEIRNAREMKRQPKLPPADEEYSGYIFPCSRRYQNIDKGGAKVPEVSIAGHALPVAVRRALESPVLGKDGKPLYTKSGKAATKNFIGIDKFTPHDLRRTAATFMSQIGFMDEIIDAVLNHVKTGIIRTYNLNKYDKEKQAALETWERKLNSILTGTETKVISMTARRKNSA